MKRLSFLILLLNAAPGSGMDVPAEPARFFESRVRPLLVERCQKCHGPEKQRGGLRVDSRQALLRGGESGPAIKPGNPEASLLLLAVRHVGERKMPPKEKLSALEIDYLTAWIKQGAPWPGKSTVAESGEAWKKHWAFQPIGNPPIPRVRTPNWARDPLDAFILAKLEEKGLKPSPAADRRTLLRRAWFDLLGLPPPPDAIAAFEKDRSPDAWEKAVDRLLASPHHGERWGRYWLDISRFADTKGYVFFEEASYPWAWTYRDYVIRALNEDLPYDRFVIEQLAADRLDLGKDRRALTALGFLTIGGRFMNNVHDILDDRIDVVTRGLLGLTVTCARCHDHKFDPIPSRDYYSLYGVFASSVEPAVPPLFFDPPRTAEYEKFDRELKNREAKLQEFLHRKHAEVTGGAKKRLAEYLVAVHALRHQPDTQEFMLIADGNDLNPAMIARWRNYLRQLEKQNDPVFAAWRAFAALPEKDFASQAKALLPRLPAGTPRRLAKALRAQPPAALSDVARIYSAVLNAVEARRDQPAEDAEEEALRQVFHGPDSPPNIAPELFNDLSLLPDRPSQAELQKLRKAVEEWRVSGPGAPPRAMALVDVPRPYEPRVFVRGNPGRPGPAVPRQFLEVLAGKERKPFRDGSGRLELARAIASKDNPLTARVLVNRVWMHHFGQGLVSTPGDFGLRSDPPTHPELLDWLARDFMESGWSLKKLHRRILLSATYCQTSTTRQSQPIDPENRLLWRANRRRLDFESLRDSLLAVSGRLEPRIGGASDKDLLSPRANRRTLYGWLDRLNVPGLYRTFDFPSPDATSPERSETTVPQQALFLMNHPFVLDCARATLRRPEIQSEKDASGKVERLYRLIFGRGPTPAEKALAHDFLGKGTAGGVEWERYVQALLLTNEFAFVD